MPLTATRPALLSKGSDTTFREFVHDFLAFSARLMAVRGGFGQLLRLSGPAYTTLIAVAFLQGQKGVGISGVAEHLHLSGAFITIEVTKLVKAGLLTKTTDPADKRRVRLMTTARARQLLDDLAAVQAPVNDALFGSLSAEEFRLLTRILPQLVRSGDRALMLLKLAQKSPPAKRTTGRRPRAAAAVRAK